MAEYTVLIAVLVAGLLGMQIYMKRAISGKLRESADSIGDAYAPGFTTSEFVLRQASDTTSTSELTRNVDIDGDAKMDGVLRATTVVDQDQTVREGNETVERLDAETLWR